MGDNQRQVVRNEETVVVGEPQQTTVSQASTTNDVVTPMAPVGGSSTVQATTTTTNPGDKFVSHNYAEQVVDPVAAEAASVDWLGRAVWFLVGLLSILLIIRFILLATGASDSAGFSQLIYGLTGWMVAPFSGLFGRSITYPGATGTAVIEFESLVAIVVVVLIGWLITKLAQLALGTNRTTGTVYSETDRKTKL